jgi:hypothetical protein
MTQPSEIECRYFHDHTPCPVHESEYLGWHAWARKMSKTHKQIRCSGCKLYAIWEPKKPAMTNGECDGQR